MEQRMKLGIIGFGRIVELVHLPLLKHVPAIEVCGVFDVTPQRLEQASRRGLQTYSDIQAMWESPVEAVLIATTPSSHFELAVQALQSGKHVLVEKPVTLTSVQAKDLREVAIACNKSVSVFQNRRYDPDYRLIQQVLHSGRLGDILFVERRHQTFGSGAAFGVKSFQPEWRNKTRFGGGALLDWGVHLVDQLLQLRLGRVEDVLGMMHVLRWNQGDVEDWVDATIRLHNGTLLKMSVNFGSGAEGPLWVIGGTDASLQVQNTKEAVIIERGKPPESIAIPPASRNAGQEIYSTFAAHLLEAGSLAVTLDEAIDVMQVLDMIRLSSQEKKGIAYGDIVFGAAARV